MNTTMAFFTFLVLTTFPSLIFSLDNTITSPKRDITLTSFTKLQFPLNLSSTGSLSFGLFNQGPYAGVADGRILKYEKLFQSFREFAYTSPSRTKANCDGKYKFYDPICGSPRGLGFNLLTGKLFSSDPFVGLTVVGPFGGLATTLVPTKNGVPYLFLSAVDVATNGAVYVTDISTVYPQQDVQTAIATGDSTGRVIKYDPISKSVTVLLTQLATPFGLATSSDASFLLVSEFSAKRIQRYWLTGEKAGTSEIFKTFPGNPNKIKRNQDGDFWIAVNHPTNDSTIIDPQAVKISPSGEILATVDLGSYYNRSITVVTEQTGKLYVAGLNITYVGQFDIVSN